MGCMWASLLYFFMTFVFGKQRKHAVKRRADTHADVGGSAADVSVTEEVNAAAPLDEPNITNQPKI